MTAYKLDAPLGVDCESGVKDGRGTGTAVSPGMGVSRVGSGEPINRVGVSVADGGWGVVSASDWVQAPIARMSSRDVNILLFILFPFYFYHSCIFCVGLQEYRKLWMIWGSKWNNNCPYKEHSDMAISQFGVA